MAQGGVTLTLEITGTVLPKLPEAAEGAYQFTTGGGGVGGGSDVCSGTASFSYYNCGYNYYYDTSCLHHTPPGDSLYTENYSSGYG